MAFNFLANPAVQLAPAVLPAAVPAPAAVAAVAAASAAAAPPPLAMLVDTMEISNLVGTFNLRVEIPLDDVARAMRNVEYTPGRFSGAIVRKRDPTGTALVFKSGKVVITGTKSQADCETIGKSVARDLKKLNAGVKFKEFKIQNIVGKYKMPFKLNFETLRLDPGMDTCRFNPEVFPGMSYKFVRLQVTMIAFQSGSLIFTGAKSEANIKEAFSNVYPIFLKHRKSL